MTLLEEAIARDSQYGSALAWAAICHVLVVNNGWSEDEEGNRWLSVEYARRALVADEEDPVALANATYALAWQGEDIDTMLGIVDRALALNPSFARGWYLSGNMKVWARVGSQPYVLGLAYLFKRQFDRAAQFLQTAIQEQPGSPLVARNLAACYALMDRLAEHADGSTGCQLPRCSQDGNSRCSSGRCR